MRDEELIAYEREACLARQRRRQRQAARRKAQARRRRLRIILFLLLAVLATIVFARALTTEAEPPATPATAALADVPQQMTVKLENPDIPKAAPPTPSYTPVPSQVTEPEETPAQDWSAEAEVLAKTVYGEARGCSTTEQAAVIWCVLNRVDDECAFWPDDIIGVATQPEQFHGYYAGHPVTQEHYALALDVIDRWQREKNGEADVGRILPPEYLYFHGDGEHNHFRTEYTGGQTWDWSLDSPYEE